MKESLNEGLFDKRKINNRFKKYAKWMADTINAYRNDPNGFVPEGVDPDKLEKVGVKPFIEDQKKELQRSYDNAVKTFSNVATPESTTTTPQAISTACALLYEFFDKYIDAKKLLYNMGLSSIDSADRENKGIDAVRTMPKSAYQRMSKLMEAYAPNNVRGASLGMEQYKRLKDMYVSNVDKLNVLGNGYRDNFTKYTKKLISDNGTEEISEKSINRINDAIASLTMTWSKQIEALKADFPTMMTQILSSEEYAKLYAYLTDTVLAEIGKPVADYTENTNRKTDVEQAVHVDNGANNADADDIFARLAASVDEPKNATHVDEGLGDFFLGTIKNRGRKCVAKIKDMLDLFKNDENGVSTKNILKGLLKFRGDDENMSIGVKPFVADQVAVIKSDFEKSKTQFEKAVNGNYAKESVNEDSIEVVDGNATTNAAVIAAGSAIIYQFLEKYTNAQKILGAAGVDIDKSRQLKVSSYKNFSTMLNAYSPKALEGNSGSLPQFSKIRAMYESMLTKFEKLIKGIINNFETSTKKKLTSDDKQMSSEDMDKLGELCTVIESSSERKIGLLKQDFPSVVKEIVTSDAYQEYYNYIMSTVLPEMQKDVKGGAESPEITTAPDVINIVDSESNKEGVSIHGYTFRMGTAVESDSNAGTDETPDSSLNELNLFNRDKGDNTTNSTTSTLPKTCFMEVKVTKGRPTLGDVYFISDEPNVFIRSLEGKLIDSGVVKEIKKGTKDLGDNIVKKLVGVITNAFRKFKASGKNMPSHSADEAAGLIEDKIKNTVAGLTPVDTQDATANSQDDQTNQTAQTNATAQNNAVPQQPAQQPAAPASAPAEEPKQENASIKISYEIGKAISESGNDVELHRTINAKRSRNIVYTLSETAWGDGLVLDPVSKLQNDVKKMLESASAYSDLAKYSKENSNIRFEKFAANETYKVSMPRNRFSLLSDGNPLYECVALVELDNSENKKVLSYTINEVSKITR